MVRFLPILLVGCSAEEVWGEPDVEAWRMASEALAATDYDSTAGWLAQIPPNSPLYEDALLVQSGLQDRVAPNDLYVFAGRPGPHQDDLVTAVALATAAEDFDWLAETYDLPWPALALGQSSSIQELGDTEEYANAFLGDSRWHTDPAAYATYLEHIGKNGLFYRVPELWLTEATPVLHLGGPKLHDQYLEQWLRHHRDEPDIEEIFLSNAPSGLPREWALLRRGAKALERGDTPTAVDSFEAVLELQTTGNHAAHAAWELGLHQYRLGHLDQALDWTEDSWQWGTRSFRDRIRGSSEGLVQLAVDQQRLDAAQRWLDRVEDRETQELLASQLGLMVPPSEPETEDPDIDSFSGARMCCLIENPTAITVVPMVDGEGIPLVQRRISSCGLWADFLTERRRDIEVCASEVTFTEQASQEATITFDDEVGLQLARSSGSDALDTCLLDIVHAVDFPGRWTVRFVDRSR